MCHLNFLRQLTTRKYEPDSSIAIVVHAFYYDVFLEIMDYLRNINPVCFKLYVTSPYELTDKIVGFLDSTSFKYRYTPVENHGRDILPFLKIISQPYEDEYELVLKIHTKKSTHRKDGNKWRNDLYVKLLKGNAIKKAINLFSVDKSIGLIGANGHIVPMSFYYEANARAIENLSHRMGVASSRLKTLSYTAGSMFYVRKQALIPLLSLKIKNEEFEQEKGQLDGTLAHAIERAFAVSTLAAGLKLVDSSYDPKMPKQTINQDHFF